MEKVGLCKSVGVKVEASIQITFSIRLGIADSKTMAIGCHMQVTKHPNKCKYPKQLVPLIKLLPFPLVPPVSPGFPPIFPVPARLFLLCSQHGISCTFLSVAFVNKEILHVHIHKMVFRCPFF